MGNAARISLVFVLLSACATTPPIPVGESPTCDGEADCKAKWDAAQLFVVKNAEMKIQIATNVLIETYNSTEYGTEIAMRVTKEPLGGGRFRLEATAWCNNFLGCSSPPRRIMAAFNSYIPTITP